MQKIEDYINSLDAASEALKKPIEEVSPADVLAKLRETNAMRRTLAKSSAAAGMIDGVYVGMIGDAQVYEAYLAEIRAKYGDLFVREAQATAQRTGFKLGDIVKAHENRLAFEASIASLGVNLEAMYQRLGEAISALTSSGEAIDPNANRHERRSSKHDKRIKEGDQVWQRRERRKYRR
jgi:hypothetical protein